MRVDGKRHFMRQEFYQLLSQKFEKDDPKEEIMSAGHPALKKTLRAVEGLEKFLQGDSTYLPKLQSNESFLELMQLDGRQICGVDPC